MPFMLTVLRLDASLKELSGLIMEVYEGARKKGTYVCLLFFFFFLLLSSWARCVANPTLYSP